MLLTATASWSIIQPWMRLPEGIEPSKNLKLENIEGPWFEVATPKTSIEVKNGLKTVSLFLKYSGPGGDKIPAFRDPNDPRFKIMLMGNGADGEGKMLLNTKSHLIKDWRSATVVLPCFASIPCAFHVIDYDEKNMLWMIVAGWDRDQVRVFSRAPGLPDDIMEDVKSKLVAFGYDVNSLRYENNLPPIPKFAPAVPKVIPPAPKFDFGDKAKEDDDDGENGEK